MPIKLAIFDVDGTLLRGETVCQTLARGLGKYERMCELELLEGREQIVAAREEMAGWYIEAGENTVRSHLTGLNWAPGVKEGIAYLQHAGVQIALASVTWSFAVEHVANALGISNFRATNLNFVDLAISHTWSETKAEYLHEMASTLGIQTANVAAVGDSLGDYDMLRVAGLPIFVGSAHPGLPNVTHMPTADIQRVAETILRIDK